MYQSIPSLTIPQGNPRGFAHSSCPRGGVFAPLSCLGVCPGVCQGGLKSKLKSANFEKSAIFALSLKQLNSSSFHMFIYARSGQCDLGPIYTVTNMQRIRIYPGNLKVILVKISPDPGQRKSNSIHVSYYWEFIRTPGSHECKYRAYSDLFSYAVNYLGKCIYTVI